MIQPSLCFQASPNSAGGNFPDPLTTKAGDDKQEWALEQVFRMALRRGSALIAVPTVLEESGSATLAVNAIAETASVSTAID